MSSGVTQGLLMLLLLLLPWSSVSLPGTRSPRTGSPPVRLDPWSQVACEEEWRDSDALAFRSEGEGGSDVQATSAAGARVVC